MSFTWQSKSPSVIQNNLRQSFLKKFDDLIKKTHSIQNIPSNHTLKRNRSNSIEVIYPIKKNKTEKGQKEVERPRPWFENLFDSLGLSTCTKSNEDDEEIDLPIGWSKQTDRLGRDLFIHHQTHQTTYKRPNQFIRVDDSQNQDEERNEDHQISLSSDDLPDIIIDPKKQSTSNHDPERNLSYNQNTKDQTENQLSQGIIKDEQIDRILLITGIDENLTISKIIDSFKVTEINTSISIKPFKIYLNLGKRGYPTILWDLVPIHKRNYIGEKFNHGKLTYRFGFIEFINEEQRDLCFNFWSSDKHDQGILGDVITFYLIDDLIDLKGCDCIYKINSKNKDDDDEICSITKQKFKFLILIFNQIAKQNKSSNLKPIWKKLTKEQIQSKFDEMIKEEEETHQLIGYQDFNEYFNDAQKHSVIKSFIDSRDDQIELIQNQDHFKKREWSLLKPFRENL
ncbi:hypothetical protein CROQUDRAFT_670843 [Cronartium quercuum f. sp. fusiforme G11]|uniref:WW domain-containing protein n=1 Tax=Cronartium quercuum f. sp. fusiforme G11 TaxID=708437 RepID=A0A9P6TDN0_9BASI|nr:hypothetical protein CROQUDRAFT_670843 [Cronartium quercuum f. sp. fusiforme G11]